MASHRVLPLSSNGERTLAEEESQLTLYKSHSMGEDDQMVSETITLLSAPNRDCSIQFRGKRDRKSSNRLRVHPILSQHADNAEVGIASEKAMPIHEIQG